MKGNLLNSDERGKNITGEAALISLDFHVQYLPVQLDKSQLKAIEYGRPLKTPFSGVLLPLTHGKDGS